VCINHNLRKWRSSCKSAQMTTPSTKRGQRPSSADEMIRRSHLRSYPATSLRYWPWQCAEPFPASIIDTTQRTMKYVGINQHKNNKNKSYIYDWKLQTRNSFLMMMVQPEVYVSRWWPPPSWILKQGWYVFTIWPIIAKLCMNITTLM